MSRWVLGALILAAAYATVLSQLVLSWWTDPYAGHGLLVPIYSAFLVWSERDRLRGVVRRRHAGGGIVVLAALGLLILGRWEGSLIVQGLSLVVAIAGTILLAFGAGFLRAVAFPACFLVFMLPLPRSVVDAVTLDLQTFVAHFAAAALGVLGVPCYHTGVVIELPTVTLRVAEACNGLRFLMALLTLTAAFAQMSQRTLRSKLALVAAALPLAIVANATRIVVIAVIAQYAGAAAASGWTHHLIGKSVWVLTLLPLLGLGLLLRRGGNDEGPRWSEQQAAERKRQPITTGAASRPYGLEG